MKFANTSSVIDEVERQLAMWEKIGATFGDQQLEQIRFQARAFKPLADTDEPLVTTGGMGYVDPTAIVKLFFSSFTPPDGYTKRNRIGDVQLRYAPNMRPLAGLRLIHFFPTAYSGISSEQALTKMADQDKFRLAGIEVLERILLNPAASAGRYWPKLSGFQVMHENAWSMVPCLGDWSGLHEIELTTVWAYDDDSFYSSPVVMEC